MYFNDRMFNPQYVNQNYYLQLQQQQYYETAQNLEVQKAVKAVRDLCETIKKLDEPHQKQAFYYCLAEMVQHYNF